VHCEPPRSGLQQAWLPVEPMDKGDEARGVDEKSISDVIFRLFASTRRESSSHDDDRGGCHWDAGYSTAARYEGG
jgi:hypothetical protein